MHSAPVLINSIGNLLLSRDLLNQKYPQEFQNSWAGFDEHLSPYKQTRKSTLMSAQLNSGVKNKILYVFMYFNLHLLLNTNDVVKQWFNHKVNKLTGTNLFKEIYRHKQQNNKMT